MSSRPLLKPHTLESGAPMTTDVITAPTNINMLPLLGYTISWTGTPTGTFSIEVCNDAQFDPNGLYLTGTGTWVPITLASAPVATGAAGTAFINISQLAAAFCRLHYTATSGTGALTVVIAGKVA